VSAVTAGIGGHRQSSENLRGEAGKPENFVQEIFEINFRLTSANFYGNQTDSTGVCSLCDPGVVLVQQLHTVAGPALVGHAPSPRAHSHNYKNVISHHRLFLWMCSRIRMHHASNVGLAVQRAHRGYRVEIAEPQTPGSCLKTSPMDWLNNYVS